MESGVQDAAAHLTRTHPAFGLRRQSELCQQAAGMTAQNGGAGGMVSGCHAGDVDSGALLDVVIRNRRGFVWIS